MENPSRLDYRWSTRREWVDVFGITKKKQYLAALLASGLCGWACTSAMGQVMVIGPGGNAAVYKGPVVASADGIYAIATSPEPAKVPLPIVAAIQNSASRYALSQALIAAVAWQESRMRQEAVSPKGARGVMQLMSTAASGLKTNPNDLSANVDAGTAYLAEMLDRFDGDIIKTLAAYNAGPKAVDRYHGVPPYPETQAYVSAVLNRLAESTNGKVHP
ncbi:MAG TPA: lytic transglycosylase domain-containing protein [Rhizomicrobium sp.]|nr:lytic transglycosylase domain-containing protein [Rhizomicrobium sp.]